MTDKAQLAHTLAEARLDQLLHDNQWVCEQKIDGVRMMIGVKDREATAYNRNGEEIEVPVSIAANFDNPGFVGEWLFDGEYLNNTYYLFDVLKSGAGMSHGASYAARRNFLESLLTRRWATVNIVLIPSALDDDKIPFFNRCKAAEVEGVMFKDLTATYKFGKRSHDMLKYKFVQTADVIVTEINRKGKDQAISIGLYANGELQNAGGCKIPESKIGTLEVNDVVECRYLYGTSEFKLYQPVFIRERKDKTPEECTTDQLKLTNKDVLL